MIKAFDINVSLTVENVRVILQTAKNIEKFAITPAWGPPPAWVDLKREYDHIEFGEELQSQLDRVNLPNFLYEEEQGEFH